MNRGFRQPQLFADDCRFYRHPCPSDFFEDDEQPEIGRDLLFFSTQNVVGHGQLYLFGNNASEISGMSDIISQTPISDAR